MDRILAGHTALVTGASRGLGRAIAARLARQGAAVAINFVSRASDADSLVDQIRTQGGNAEALQADIGDPAQAERLIARATERLGPLSILINNAGVAYRATLATFDAAGMERMRRTNVDGLIHVTRFAANEMRP